MQETNISVMDHVQPYNTSYGVTRQRDGRKVEDDRFKKKKRTKEKRDLIMLHYSLDFSQIWIYLNNLMLWKLISIQNVSALVSELHQIKLFCASSAPRV